MKWKDFSVNDAFPMKHIHFDECVSFFVPTMLAGVFGAVANAPSAPAKIALTINHPVVQLLLISTNH